MYSLELLCYIYIAMCKNVGIVYIHYCIYTLCCMSMVWVHRSVLYKYTITVYSICARDIIPSAKIFFFFFEIYTHKIKLKYKRTILNGIGQCVEENWGAANRNVNRKSMLNQQK